MTEQEFDEQHVRITDKRRVDPETFEVRQQESAPADELEVELADVDAKVAELTADLQRVHAEYANYRKRVERDRESIRLMAIGATLGELLSVLDGAFKTVGESLEATTAKLGLERFGTAGEAFDPNIHEALTSEASDEVSEPTVVAVYQPGYRYADRVLRPARVAVAGTD